MHPDTAHRLTFVQYWRLLTTFLYFGPLSLDLLFHVFFLQRYSRLLEESSGRSPAHFSWLLLYATTLLICLSPLLSIPFLGSALSSSLVYIWSRRNPETRLSFLGLLVFTAPYLPWVLMAFSLVLHGTVPKDEICGVIVGHSKLKGTLSVVSPPPQNNNTKQYGISSRMYIHRYTTAIGHLILHSSGEICSRDSRLILELSQSTMRLQPLLHLMSDDDRRGLMCESTRSMKVISDGAPG